MRSWTWRRVVHLDCSAETVFQRIRTNVGGDRTERPDDQRQAIGHKLRLFTERTAPLVDHYHSRGVRIVTLQVTAATTAEQMWQTLDRQGPAAES